MRRALLIALLSVLPATAADHWTRISTPDFEIYTAAGERKGKDALRHFEQVREFFLLASPVRSLGDVPLRIFQFDTAEQYAPFRPNASTVAAFVAAPDREYILLGDRTLEDFHLAIHEYMHLIVRHSGLKLPLWLNEGWADVYSSLRPKGKDTAVGDLLPDRMNALESTDWMDFDKLTSIDKQSPEYHEGSRSGIFYAESWALAHMLYLSPEYKDHFGKFIGALQNGATSAEACQIAFGKSSSAVFADLRAYFKRKKLYGTVFEARLEAKHAEAVVSAVPDFDARLALADLRVAVGRRDEAREEYSQLEKEQPERADVAESQGNLAFWSGDSESARRYYAKAFDRGSQDVRICFELAMLDREAKESPAVIAPILERVVKLRPDLVPAKIQLGLVRMDTRDFPGVVSTLMSIPNITSRQAEQVYCALAVALVHTGDLAKAAEHAGNCRKWAKTDPETRRAEAITRFVEARSKPYAAVRPAERLRQTAGIARNLLCAPEGNRLQVAIGDKVANFDLPEPAAIELPVTPQQAFALSCGALKPVRIRIEFAPPRSAMETSVGVVRRLDY